MPADRKVRSQKTLFFETEVVAEVLDAALMMRRISISRGGNP